MIQKRNIVTVMLKDSSLYDKQGKVVEISDDNDEDGNIGVKFGLDGEELLGFCGTEKEKIIRFCEHDLRVDDDWTIESKVYKLFGKMWHTLYIPKKSLEANTDCAKKDCKNKASSKSMINIWGSVYEVYLCKSCRKSYHGKGMDDFSFR